jgi:hypothetical protein
LSRARVPFGKSTRREEEEEEEEEEDDDDDDDEEERAQQQVELASRILLRECDVIFLFLFLAKCFLFDKKKTSSFINLSFSGRTPP